MMKWCFLLAFCISVQYSISNEQLPSYLRKKYDGLGLGFEASANTGGVKTYVKTGGGGVKTSGGGVKTKSPRKGGSKYQNQHEFVGGGGFIKPGFGGIGIGIETEQFRVKGGCSKSPDPPMNGGLKCSYSGCRATCSPNYQFPNAKTQLSITCQDGEWHVEGTEWDSIPACEPICLPRCENNGICIEPNKCDCPDNFSGPQCQYENKPCMNYPKLPMNARRTCRTNRCTITCNSGYVFPDTSSIAVMECKNGQWKPSRDNWQTIPDCQPTCNPPCQNGGNCLSFNVCQCPQEYRGPQCQYSVTACSAKQMGFNGAYKCKGNAESFSCNISCPEGIQFEFPPADTYTCVYSKGVFEPQPIPKCLFSSNMIITNTGGSGSYGIGDTFGISRNYGIVGNGGLGISDIYAYNLTSLESGSQVKGSKTSFVPMPRTEIIQHKKPEPSSCFTWGGSHFKTFDGKVFSFNSDCAHTLVKDDIDNTFSIVVQNVDCTKNPDNCYRMVKIYLQDNEYMLKKSDNGVPVFASLKKTLPIPAQLPGIRVEMIAHYVVLSLDSIGAKIKWDGEYFVQVNVNEALWNRTSGLCGKADGDGSNDMVTKEGHHPKSLVTLATSWQVNSFNDECNSVPTEEHACQSRKDGKALKALEFCQKLLADKRFQPCHQIMDISVLLDACRWDYCNCKSSDSSKCACNTLNMYTKECAHKGITKLANWRDKDTCPMTCSDGKIYMECGPKGGQEVCGASVEKSDEVVCEEGCYCPPGTVLSNNKCVTKDKCPCKLRGKEFKSGESIPKDCNTCTCVEGQWVCTQISCGARCSAVGDPHYLTFDGKRYDFMGQCSYYLVKNDNFSIEAENVACTGSISEAMNFPVSVASGLPSCTKAVTINILGQKIKLKQNQEILVNDKELNKIPYTIKGITIRSVSSIFIKVELPNGIEVWWDGQTRVYVDMPPNFKQKTAGLCGTFNNNQKDDFITPENDIEQSVISFANKWKTQEKCNDIPERLKHHPCDLNIQNKATAEKYCKKLKSHIFQDCHWHVDPEPFYQDCMYDMCACEGKISKCLCSIVAAYGQECAEKGVKIDWRDEIHECGIHCPGGQKYQVCGDSCSRTCYDITLKPDCKQKCVEGCNCPPGQTLDIHGECIPIGQCPCQQDGLEFPANYKEIRPASKGPELCTCTNAAWICRPAKTNELKSHPHSDSRGGCKTSDNFEFTACESPEPVTCKNMHSQDFFSADICHPGCQCKEGYVLDSSTKKCVKPQDCPCHHGGKSYRDNSTVQVDCNTCECHQGKWKCTDRQCAAECSAWGDSHFKTFDGKHYDFQGQCDYLLAKGVLSPDNTFDITIQNVPCGTLGVSCSKSVTIKVGTGTQQETVTLTRGKKLQEQINSRMTVRNQGIFVVVEAPDLGLIVHWDKGTRVYVKVDPRWKNLVRGLCGNYNNDETDDFQTPSGGISEASPQLFGDSWKLQSYCPDAMEITDTCEQRPERKIWAMKQCGLLKSQTFAPCHAQVAVDLYYEKCIFDSCACDQGGDCECLCTAIAAYAQECNTKGVPIKWRTSEFCPMQCDEGCAKYSPCVSTCPLNTCDNIMNQNAFTKLCKEDTCVEGCEPKPCPPGQVYYNSTFTECVPTAICKISCMEIDGIMYYEGDLIDEDECHTCHCSRGKKVCQGEPCKEDNEEHQNMQQHPCKDGWTAWINQDVTATIKGEKRKETDIEPLETLTQKLKESSGPSCDLENMVDIECRTVKGHKSPKDTSLDVECSLERGLKCVSPPGKKKCPDFEMRVKCDCKPKCDINNPYEAHPTDCSKYKACIKDSDNRLSIVEKSCLHKFFNPQNKTCDWPENVVKIRPECAAPTTTESYDNKNIILPSTHVAVQEKCPPGQKWDDCAIECDRMCLHFNYAQVEKGVCTATQKCMPGCVSAHKKLICPEGKFYTNQDMCVDKKDCMCRLENGTIIKPGRIFTRNDCEHCQCANNELICDDSKCRDFSGIEEIILAPPNLDENETVIFSTLSPPPICNEDMYIDLIQGDQPLPDDAFNASSYLKDTFKPQHARLNSKPDLLSGGAWSPAVSDQNQFLQVNFGRQEPVYGVKIKGSPLYNEYVKSYTVSYSPDGVYFYNITDKNKDVKVFRGSSDSVTEAKEMFDVPIEAKIVRIHPKSWNDGISLQVEFIGCAKLTTTPYYPTPRPILCEDPMGVDNKVMSSALIKVSSSLNPKHDNNHLKLGSNTAWQPLTNTANEFIEFNFTSPRNLTGFITKGGPKGWVTTYKVLYSTNHKDWNPLVDENMKPSVIIGNFDEDTPITNHFNLPIQATYLKLIPTKWNKNIQMRVEPLGCFKEYPEINMHLVLPTQIDRYTCNKCPDVDSPAELELGACRCTRDKWWDGTSCVERTQCPCVVGNVPYAIGAAFENEECEKCICTIGGKSVCTPMPCEKCAKGLRSVVTSTCGCLCQPCEEGKVLCPTSNICINETLWCNGIIDCPDDEINCDITTTTEIITTTEVIKRCQEPSCPPGYKITIKKTRNYGVVETMFTSKRKGNALSHLYAYETKNTKGGIKGKKRKQLPKPELIIEKPEIENEEDECPQFQCVSTIVPPPFHTGEERLPEIVCPLATCPPGYTPELNLIESYSKNICPEYECKAPPPPDVICNVTGHTFNTFDDTEFKYDICNHVLARDLEFNDWEISMKRNCRKNVCKRDLVILHDEHKFVLFPDLSVEYDGFKYTVEQTKKIGSQSQFFSISMLGDNLLFVSNRFGFWVLWDRQGSAKIGLSVKLENKVDGLCGYYNDYPEDDKRKPNGDLAKTTVEFGDSWAVDDAKCEEETCPTHIQNKAWEICNQVKEQTFAPCGKVIDLEAFISRCLETTCACLQSANGTAAEDQCRCQSLSNFVVDCLQTDTSIELLDWRSQHDCPVLCPAPLVHHDCYRRKCEQSCETISDPNACPTIPNVCFPGCYCAPGLVRHGDSCIKSSNCRDCECNVLPHLQYVTYDEHNFTINGNCVYVMSRDILPKSKTKSNHKFQVLITNHPCDDNPAKMCVGKVTILYNGHKIHILRDKLKGKLKVIIDGEKLDDLSAQNFMKITETRSKHLKFYLTKIQVQVNIYYPSLGVAVKAPSHKYGGKLEGLCGDCNKDRFNDGNLPNGKPAETVDELAVGWLYDIPGQNAETCKNVEEKQCEPLPADQDPCQQLLDSERYAQCHPVLDPSMFLDWCKKDTCGGSVKEACEAIAAYGNECLNSGFCVHWNSDLCPAKTCPVGQSFKECGNSCAKTCENIKDLGKCKPVPLTGCFCPEGMVKLNDTCVIENHCETCDEEGHHPGDVWQKDACTNCTCEGTNLKCETKHCPAYETVCQKGYSAIKVPQSEKECCEKYVCVPVEVTPSPTCEPAQKIQCAPDQNLKLDFKADGCEQFICQCKPAEECNPIDHDKPLEDGMIKIINEKGCCPIAEYICKKELCPKPEECPKFYHVQNYTIPGKCCETYRCEPPKEKCIVEPLYIADPKGGERLRNQYEKQQTLKTVNETWQDGPCRDCKCVGNEKSGYHSTCSITECPSIKSSQDFNDYELEYVPIPDECCGTFVRKQCKDAGKVYAPGEKWYLEDDYCTEIECVETPAGLQKQTSIKTCDSDCEIGHIYVPAPSDSHECCGTCKQVACIDNGIVRREGEEWVSDDFCTSYLCEHDNASYQVKAFIQTCPEISAELVKDFVIESIPVPGECCLKRTSVACRVGKHEYKVGETWPSPDGDLCKTVTCVKKNDGELVKQEHIQTCKTECLPGWEYKESNTTCCGECVQYACIVDEVIRHPYDNWTLPDDNCTLFTCLPIDGQFSILTMTETCPNIDTCPPEFIYKDGCCEQCNMTAMAQMRCAPEEIAEKRSVGIIKVQNLEHGKCTNKHPIKGLTECVGSCHSATFFNAKTAEFESACSCCKATKYKDLIVDLDCEDGNKTKKKISVPSACNCEGCLAAPVTKLPIKGGVKTKSVKGY